MSRPPGTIRSDESLDRHLRAFLAAEAADVGGVPTATEMAQRIARRGPGGSRAISGRTGAPRAIRTVALLGLLALLLAIMLAVIAGQQRSETPRLLGDGPIHVDRQVFDAETGEQLAGVCPGCGRIRFPSWSADGTRMGFLGDGITILDTRTGTTDTLGVCRGCGDADSGLRSYVSLAADGSTVTYAEDGQIRVMDVASRAVRELTQLPPGQTADGPTLSPDGRQVAFILRDEAGGDAPGLWVVGADGEPPRQLVADASTWDPAWSPDGSTIAYVREGFGPDYELWLYDVPTGTQRKMWEMPGCCFSDWGGPGWAPDGTRIAVVVASGRLHQFGLWVVDVGTGESHQVVGGVSVSRPAWRPVAVDPASSAEGGEPSGTTATTPPGDTAACDAVRMHPGSPRVPLRSWDPTGLAGGIAVGVADQAFGPTDMLYVAGGSPATLAQLAIETTGDVAVTAWPLVATSSRSAIVQVVATSLERPLANCSDLWRITADDGIPLATRLTTSTGGQDIVWTSVSPTGRSVAYTLDDTTGGSLAQRLAVVRSTARPRRDTWADQRVPRTRMGSRRRHGRRPRTPSRWRVQDGSSWWTSRREGAPSCRSRPATPSRRSPGRRPLMTRRRCCSRPRRPRASTVA